MFIGRWGNVISAATPANVQATNEIAYVFRSNRAPVIAVNFSTSTYLADKNRGPADSGDFWKMKAMISDYG